jgi:hypothetical protein
MEAGDRRAALRPWKGQTQQRTYLLFEPGPTQLFAVCASMT